MIYLDIDLSRYIYQFQNEFFHSVAIPVRTSNSHSDLQQIISLKKQDFYFNLIYLVKYYILRTGICGSIERSESNTEAVFPSKNLVEVPIDHS